MAPVCAALVADLGPDDFVHVKCAAGGRTELLTAKMPKMAGVGPEGKVTDIGKRMRCQEYDERGRAVVSIR